MRKRFIAFSMMAVTMAGLFTGCGGGGYSTSGYYDTATDYYSDEFYGNTEEYNEITENDFKYVTMTPLSTFAIDVDTGSYSNLRRMVNDDYTFEDINGDAIRTEEMLNYFDYTIDAKNVSDGKFSVQYETQVCPWNTDNQLLLMTVAANETDMENQGNNFVFLIDVSGSMSSDNKLPLAVDSFELLTEQLDENDRVSIVTYSGEFATVLDGCPGNEYKKICKALNKLKASGCTNGSGGIEAAYDCALENYITGGNNRVIVASDGDMNLGITDQDGLVDLITEKKESGVFLTTLGFGDGNYKDSNMEQIADAGNGNYYYIDCIEEAERVLVDKMMQTTVTVAKDVKLQAEFNPTEVYQYRLLGYENRILSAEDFEDDTVDGGEVGAGQQVTVLYEIVPASENNETKQLKYQEATAESDDILTLSIRYKEPKENESVLEEYPVVYTDSEISQDFMLAAGCAEFALVIHDSQYKGQADLDEAYALVNQGAGENKYRQQFAQMLVELGADEDTIYKAKESTFDKTVVQEEYVSEESGEDGSGDGGEAGLEDAEGTSENMITLYLGTLDDTSYSTKTELMTGYNQALEELNTAYEALVENGVAFSNQDISQNVFGEYLAIILVDETIWENYQEAVLNDLTDCLEEYGFAAVTQVK